MLLSTLRQSQNHRHLSRTLNQRKEQALWTFVRMPEIAETNNAAERALRHPVQWRKASYGTQSERGSRFVESILTVLTTCQQQQQNAFTYLTACCHAFFKNAIPPPLIPQPGRLAFL